MEQAEIGLPIGDMYTKAGIVEATFHSICAFGGANGALSGGRVRFIALIWHFMDQYNRKFVDYTRNQWPCSKSAQKITVRTLDENAKTTAANAKDFA